MAQTTPPDTGNSGKSSRLSSVSTEQDIYELQLTTLQEQLVASAIDNQSLRAELDELKKNTKVEKISKELEYERTKSSQLLKQLREFEARTKLLESEVKRKALEKSTSDSTISSRKASIGPEDNTSLTSKTKSNSSSSSSSGPGRVLSERTWKERIQDSVTTVIYDLVSDFTAEPVVGETVAGSPESKDSEAEEDPLTVKQLKENILRFKLSAGRVYRFGKAIYELITWESPLQTSVAFVIYMYAVWHGWLLPVLLFLAIFRLYINYLNSRGWKIGILAIDLEEPEKETLQPELALSDRFHLVVDVARKVQNTLGILADYLEKIKNLLTWQQPDETRHIMIMLCIAFVMSCVMSGPHLFVVFGLYFGIKMFIIEYLYSRYPRFKQHHDSTYKMWQALPTDADLEERKKSAQREINSSTRQQQRKHNRSGGGGSSQSGSSCEDEGEEAMERELTEDDKSFCLLFDLPFTERPLRGWESGWRATLLDKSRPILRSVSRNGRLYLTNSYLCMERNKTPSPKNFLITLKDITRIEKVRPVTWMPGGGMCIEISVTGFEQPYTFAAIVNRDVCFDALVTHGISLGLAWALEHQSKGEEGCEKSESGDMSRAHELQSTTFRMSDLMNARTDYDDLTTFAE